MTRDGTNTSAPKGVHARVTDVVRAHTLHAAEQLDVHAHLEGELGIDSVLFGGSGVMQGRIGRYLRDAIPGRVFSGTSEIQRNNIIARTLGLGG